MFVTRRIWEERFYPTDKGWGVFDIALDPEKRILLIAAFEKGLQRFRLDGQSAAILERSPIKEKHGHRGNVIKVSWHPLGKRFATCGTDSLTIIWKDDFTPEQQVRLAEIPQTLAWNPTVHILITAAGPQLASISVPRDPSLYRLQSNIWCAAWNHIGQIYAVGLDNGAVSVRDRRDNEMCLIHGTLNAPVWDVAWTPAEAPRPDVLVVLDWSCAIGFYQATGKQFRATCKLDFVPLRVSFSPDWHLLYVCAADKKIYVVSIDGVVIGKIAECRSWPLRFLQRRTTSTYKSDFLVIGADGLINMLQIAFDKCWHYHSGLYASRESLVNLSVRSLERNRETTIAVGEAVHKIALYRSLMAVVVPNAVVIYRQNTQEMMLRYEEVTRMAFQRQCNVVLLAAQHVVMVHQAKIEAMNFQGAVTQVCVNVTGGSPGQESLCVALIDGAVIRLFLNQPFLHTLLKIPSVPIGLDVNLNHSKLAVVGENNVIYVYDLASKVMLYQEPGADSCAWNQYHPDMLAFSTGSLLKIKMRENKVHTRRTETPMNGKVIGYAGSKVFYETTEAKAVVVDVPHTMLIHQSKA
ncbi:hypothetical protein RvY_13447 [Ramazzottius varieornatus]|uniref:IFT122 second beta-propeller domain-containing protein n=1 Tax=Ramazzottius varieornatus TaxID=947166 RepID=A0A1D1VQ28_RAMVA|nr:hypothetical protein RvY_13447 [Ramazzottius varieornatus]